MGLWGSEDSIGVHLVEVCVSSQGVPQASTPESHHNHFEPGQSCWARDGSDQKQVARPVKLVAPRGL